MNTLPTPLLLPVLATLLTTPGLIAQQYTVTDLGAIAYDTSRGHDINETGQITGDTLNAAGNWRAFVWTAGTMVEVPALVGYAGDYGYGYGINALGQVVGESGYTNPFLWDGTTTIDLGDLGGGSSGAAHAVNDSTQVVGYALHTSGYDHAFLWDNGVMTDLGVLSSFGGRSEARDINNAGQVVGVSATNSGQSAFLWENGVMTDLGGISAGSSIAYGISGNGFIVGSSSTASYRTHATLWAGGSAIDLGTLKDPDPSSSEARDVNNLGQVVGWSHAHNTFNRHAFLFDAGTLKDLNDLIPAGTGWELEEAYAINDAGKITGYGHLNGKLHAFLLEPPNPATLVLTGPTPGTAGVLNTVQVSQATPGARVYIAYGQQAGSTPVPGCPGLSVSIATPTASPPLFANAQGEVQFSVFVPAPAVGRTYLIQATEPSACAISNLVSVTFQ